MSLEQVWERSNERERGRGEKPVELCGREEEKEQGRGRVEKRRRRNGSWG